MDVSSGGRARLGALSACWTPAARAPGSAPLRSGWSDTVSFLAVSDMLLRDLPAATCDGEAGARLRTLARDADAAARLLREGGDAGALETLDGRRRGWRDAMVGLLRAAGAAARERAAGCADAGAPRIGSTRPEPTLRPAPPIERIALRGGGAKGQAYGGALAFADALGALDGVTKVAGASVGSIAAAYLACGASGESLSRRLLEGDMSGALADDRERFEAMISSTGIRARVASGWMPRPLAPRSGERLATETDDALRACALRACALQRLAGSDAHPPAVAQVRDALRAGEPMTFARVGALADAGSPGFRHLAITAFDRMSGELLVFDSQDRHGVFADVPVALAIRGSAALPLVLAPVEIEAGGRVHRLVDAGVKSNIPLDALRPDGPPGDARPDFSDTMIFTFADRGATDAKLHAPDYERHCAEPRWAALMAGNPRLSEDRADDARRLRAVGPNVLVLDHGALATTSFGASVTDKLLAQLEGELCAARFFAIRHDQAVEAPAAATDRPGPRFPERAGGGRVDAA
jgi:predicted acylesterase/phospholipase RssA